MELRHVQCLAALLVLCLLGGRALADDDAAGDQDKQAPLVADVADAVAAAAADEDVDRLTALASADAPDPWFVVEELLRDGKRSVAASFAKLTPGRNPEALAAYLTGRAGQPISEIDHELLDEIEGLQAQGLAAKDEAAKVLALLDERDAPLDTVVRVRLGIAEAEARGKARAHVKGAERYLEVARAAEKIGWLPLAGRACFQAGRMYRYAGKKQAALAALAQAQSIRQALDDKGGVAHVREVQALVHQAMGKLREAHDIFQSSLSSFQAAEDAEGVARLHYRLGFLLTKVSRYDEAMKHHETAFAMAEATGDDRTLAFAHRGIGIVLEARGNFRDALARYETSLAMWEHIGDEASIQRALNSVAIGHYNLGNLNVAVARFEALLARAEIQGTPALIAQTMTNLGTAYESVGDLQRALGTLNRARALNEKLGNPIRAAGIQNNLGSLHKRMGSFPEALAAFENARDGYEKIGDGVGVAGADNNLGVVYSLLGDYDRAERYYRSALDANQAAGRQGDVAIGLLNLAQIQNMRGELEAAQGGLEEAISLMDESGNRSGKARALASLGGIWTKREDHERALEYFRESLALLEAVGDRVGVIRARCDVGNALYTAGSVAEGLTMLEEAAREAQSLRATELRVFALTNLVLALLIEGENEKALSIAQEADRDVEELLGGLAEEEGALAREKHARILGGGALAALRLGNLPAMLAFVERSRASLLLEFLDPNLRWTLVSDELRAEKAIAKAAESKARRTYDEALSGSSRKARQRASKALAQAHSRLREVHGRIQRKMKKDAGILFPRPATIEQIQAGLADDTAMIVYATCFDYVAGLLITKDDAKAVSLGLSADVFEAAAALRLDDPKVDSTGAIAVLRHLLADVMPLPKSVKRLIISSDGALTYMPFGVIFENHAVALTPSASTHVLLDRERASLEGKRVLALGDPLYGADPGGSTRHRGPPLLPLPATRIEANAVGDVILLGAEATQSGLLDAVAKNRRWRAVHLACHGFVDASVFTRSSLALTQEGEQDDGYLTVIEIQDARIPSDLVVLSACKTSTGRIYAGEGIVGLARSFMQAGTPRVICSLWKVDDDATQALMVKFYELWKGGTDAAEALKGAQAHVRNDAAHLEWKHPYYWAAWVLWGLPD